MPSSVLLGRFVTGLLPDITKQILLRGVPTKMEDAVRSAIEIERALGFQTAPETQPVQALRVEETTEISSSKKCRPRATREVGPSIAAYGSLGATFRRRGEDEIRTPRDTNYLLLQLQ